MTKKQKRQQPPRRKRMKRAQGLQSAKSWLETYEGSKVVRDYRRRYRVSWKEAFTELGKFGVSIDPDYKEHVLHSVATQASAKRQQRARERARWADVWPKYEDDDTVLERAGECMSCDIFRPLGDLGLCPVCAGMLERDLIRQRDWEYSATVFLFSDEDQEALRQQVVAEYGEGVELIAVPWLAKRRRKKGQ